MFTLSVGILYSSHRLLKQVGENLPINASEFPHMFQKYYVASSKLVLEASLKCKWLEINLNGYLVVTTLGEDIIKCSTPAMAIREQLKHYIYAFKPSWSKILHNGRAEVLYFLPHEIKQCIEEADLVNNYDDETIKWWDILAEFARKGIEDKKNFVGRTGEKLSVQFEEKRIGSKPIWQSIESNYSGFDLLSKVDKNDKSNLKIEVKTTTSFSSSIGIHITRNEWSVAEDSDKYIFHIWVLNPNIVLYILHVDQIRRHIPIEQGEGSWESTKIDLKTKEMQAYKVDLLN